MYCTLYSFYVNDREQLVQKLLLRFVPLHSLHLHNRSPEQQLYCTGVLVLYNCTVRGGLLYFALEHYSTMYWTT